MMQRVYTDVPWSMAWLSLRCAQECSHLCKSLTALVPTAPSRRAQAAGPAAQVCLGFLAAAWLNGKRERGRECVWEWAGGCEERSAQLSSTSARLHWLSIEREQGDRDGPCVAPQWWITLLRADSGHWQQFCHRPFSVCRTLFVFWVLKVHYAAFLLACKETELLMQQMVVCRT